MKTNFLEVNWVRKKINYFGLNLESTCTVIVLTKSQITMFNTSLKHTKSQWRPILYSFMLCSRRMLVAWPQPTGQIYLNLNNGEHNAFNHSSYIISQANGQHAQRINNDVMVRMCVTEVVWYLSTVFTGQIRQLCQTQKER